MWRRGPIQPYLGHKVSTTMEPKEFHYYMGLMGLMEDYKKKEPYGLYLILLATTQDLFGFN